MASFLLDLGNTTLMQPSLLQPALSGVVGSASGAYVGQGVDMSQSHGFSNMVINMLASFGSGGGGECRIGVQCSDTDVSGAYTDPTSGLAAFPTVFQSGGIVYLNSGSLCLLSGGGGSYGPAISGHMPLSGVIESAGFLRPQRYARAIMFGSGQFGGDIAVGFIEQLHTTGSGGGFSWSPQGSGQVPSV